MKITIKNANEKNIKEYYNILSERVKWLEKNNITQWDKNYLEEFNVNYFNKNKENVFVALKNNKVVGGMLLRDKDIYYKREGEAFYLHHFISKINENSVGKLLIKYALDYAKENEKKYLRLDCISTNKKLNDYYLENNFVCTDYLKKKKNNYYNLYEIEVL